MRRKAAALCSASEECGELKVRLASARTAAAAAKQAAQQQEFQLQAQVNDSQPQPPKEQQKTHMAFPSFRGRTPTCFTSLYQSPGFEIQAADPLWQGQGWGSGSGWDHSGD